ncbi:nucleotidyltransferase substrate binding protein [Marispirochaeta sp.]|uniref:nucleotidyltransferase substrate binding protein n=1 Tax=Marispirochaeta sp. TaxID=2038653 RepID=UPI0029C7D236|nr:nucleotidyltransferase substrate binding protein [Marispirochaeta sp.]
MSKDVRWKQRFENFKRASAQLKQAVGLFRERPLSLIEQQGLIQAFEYTHELAWKTLQDYFIYQGNTDIKGSRDAFREGVRYSLLNDGQIWMEMIQARNLTSHAYDLKMAEEVIKEIVEKYFHQFLLFETTMSDIETGEE